MESHNQKHSALVKHYLIILLVITTPAISSASSNFPAIFNFGDSNSDTGGLSAAFGQAPSPNGETYFHRPAGRFSDGRLLIDFIAEGLGIPYINAYLESVGSNFSHGANFATAGSTIRPQNTTIRQSGFSPISLDVQFIQFSDFRARSKLFSNQGVFEKLLPKDELFSRALYTFDIGQNDLTSGYKLNMTTEQVKGYVPDLLDQFSDVIKNIYAQGGRTFWIHNTSPVGCYPYVLDQFPVTSDQIDEHGCARPYNDVCRYFNSRLEEVVVQFRKDFPTALFTYVDIYSLKYMLFSNATQFGFEDPLVACCGHGGKYNYNKKFKCGGKVMVDGKEIVVAKSCKNPSIKISWDGVHFTEAANKWIFQQISNHSFSQQPIPFIINSSHS